MFQGSTNGNQVVIDVLGETVDLVEGATMAC